MWVLGAGAGAGVYLGIQLVKCRNKIYGGGDTNLDVGMGICSISI